MLSRRAFCSCLSAAMGFAATSVSAQGGQGENCEVFSRARQQAMTPESALQRLREGHERFLAGKTVNCDLLNQARGTASGQAPFAAVLGCIDSRVPIELVFDQRIGDLFAARIAGNFVNTDILGSLEFATKIAGAKLVVVLGHSECGAIKGAIDNVRIGNIGAMLANITPAVLAARDVEGERSSKNARLVQAVIESNVKLAMEALVQRSAIIRDLAQSGEIRIVGAIHDLSTGRLRFLD